ncbi:MAG: hypothetical protein ACXVFA_05945 [Solirubrobacteraceae bacterium]
MNAIHPITTPPAFPPFRQRLGEIVPLVGFVPVAGPPAIFIVGPWLLLVLMLAGPFLLLVTLAAIALCLAVLVSFIGAILATPYLLARRLHGRRAAHASSPLLDHRRERPDPCTAVPG